MCERVYLVSHFLTGELTAIVADTSAAEADSKHGNGCIRLSRTIFHPQGGGQPSDVGCISREKKTFEVKFVQSVGDDVLHYGNFVDSSPEDFPTGCEVKLDVDLERRALHTRLHSAGHTLDAAIDRLGYAHRLKPGKGYHFPDGPYVEYDGELTSDEVKSLPLNLTEGLHQLVAESITSRVVMMSREEATSVCKDMDLSSYPDSVRIVYVADLPCPCGGTHVHSTTDLGQVVVTKIKAKKGKIRISYELRI
jgi:Ser-tRNA(Ala) deacylase AlaX